MHCDILISRSTYDRVYDLIEVGEPATTPVKGRLEPVEMYPVVGLKEGYQLGEHLLELPEPEYEAEPAPIISDDAAAYPVEDLVAAAAAH